MKYLLSIMLSFITLTALAQKNQTVDLKWKIENNEKLTYVTVMDDIETSDVEMDFGEIFNSFSDSLDIDTKEFNDLFKSLNQASQNLQYVTALTIKGNGIIDIVMTIRPMEPVIEAENDVADSEEADFFKMMQSMSQGVQLRGSVYETGGIHSFWVKTSQKNLIALLFELPTHPVKVGDKWSLDVNLITNDHNFDCDTAYKINEVELVDIKIVKGETIAVLNYNIVEYVKGNFTTPSFFGNESKPTETMMKFTHQGVADFSVDKGRWINYDGIMSLETTGVMKRNSKTKFKLINEKSAGK